jgi:hypothetical protein
VTTVCFLLLHTGRGCNGHPAFPAPLFKGRAAPSLGGSFLHNSGASCRGNAEVCLFFSSSFRGALLREPGIHNPCVVVQHQTLSQGVWIPGPRKDACPGMTTFVIAMEPVIGAAICPTFPLERYRCAIWTERGNTVVFPPTG